MASPLVCSACGKALDGEPNFCPACGADMRGLTPTSDTLSGPLSGKIIDGRYRILEKIGEGGMGSVFKVEHVRMEKVLALKVLRPDGARDKGLLSRFRQEAKTIAKLSHSNTVQVFDSGELEDGSLFIAMEYLPGRDLAWHLRAHGAMTEEKAASIGIQLLSSLAEAHALGIVHRDIKPANVLLVRKKDRDDQVKLLDFGIAKLNEGEARKTITGITEFVGTPGYMSPEQGKGDPLDARSDLYSVGALLFELVTGRELFPSTSPMATVNMHMTQKAPRVNEVRPDRPVSPMFEEVLRRALQKDPAERWPDADKMRAALEKLRRELGALSADFTPTPEELASKVASREDFDNFEKRLRRRQRLAPLVAAGVLLAISAAGFRAWDVHRRATPGVAEVEPNDQPREATRMALGAPMQGVIGAAEAGSHDRDLFVLEVPQGSYRVSVSGVEDLNLTLELLQLEPRASGTDELVRRVFLDDRGPGEPEQLDGFFARRGPLYLRVEEAPFVTEPRHRPRRERGLVPYALTVQHLDGKRLEEEPNDSPASAQNCPLTEAVTAYTGAKLPAVDAAERNEAPFSSPDFFQVEVKGEAEKVAVLVAPGAGCKLQVVDSVAWESWAARRAAATSPGGRAAQAPEGLELDGQPGLKVLSPAGGKRRVRVTATDCEPGTPYYLAFVSGDAQGANDLAQKLLAEGRGEAGKRALELAGNEFNGGDLKAKR
ncbi:MAG: protein kinase [Archangiaceae bacterium]|nr:protein kinase [Archangiaceae bacterium]